MNSTPPFWRESVSQLPRLVARERVNAGDAVRGIAIQCRILEASFPPLTPLTQVLEAVQDRLNTADQEGVDRCMAQLRGHVIRRMRPHVLTTLTAFAPRLNFLRRREDVPSPLTGARAVGRHVGGR